MKNPPLTPAQRKRVQRARDKAILKQCGFNSIEDVMRMVRNLNAEGQKKFKEALDMLKPFYKDLDF